jgi:hypothetical protein
MEQATQTSPKLEDMFIPISDEAIIKKIDCGVQTIIDKVDWAVQTQPILTLDLNNLEPGFRDWITYSHSEKSAQTLLQTLEKGIQTMVNPDLIIHGNVTEVLTSSPELIIQRFVNTPMTELLIKYSCFFSG